MPRERRKSLATVKLMCKFPLLPTLKHVRPRGKPVRTAWAYVLEDSRFKDDDGK
jgi:hypothetical protein